MDPSGRCDRFGAPLNFGKGLSQWDRRFGTQQRNGQTARGEALGGREWASLIGRIGGVPVTRRRKVGSARHTFGSECPSQIITPAPKQVGVNNDGEIFIGGATVWRDPLEGDPGYLFERTGESRPIDFVQPRQCRASRATPGRARSAVRTNAR